MRLRLTTANFISKAQSIHGNKYNYSLAEYISSHIKVKIICKEHGVFVQTPNHHVRGRGCSKCGDILIAKKKRLSRNEFIQRASRIHGNKYDYSDVIYVDSHTKVKIICKEHNKIFLQLPYTHISRTKITGCKTCFILKREETNIKRYGVCNPLKLVDIRQKQEQTMVEKYGVKRPAQVHMSSILPLLNDKDWLIEQYVNQNKTSYSISKVLNVDQSTVYTYLKKHNIPTLKTTKFSKSAIRWLNSIMEKEEIYIQHAGNVGEYNIPGTKYAADGYCKENNTIYEFYGDRFHGNPEVYGGEDRPHPFDPDITARDLYNRTIEREVKIRELGYKIKSLWEKTYAGNSYQF